MSVCHSCSWVSACTSVIRTCKLPQPVRLRARRCIAVTKQGGVDFPEVPLCQHAAANRNNINCLRRLWCVFSNLPENAVDVLSVLLSAMSSQFRSDLCVYVCVCGVCVCCQSKESYRRKNQSELIHTILKWKISSLIDLIDGFLILWDHARRGWDTHPLPANRVCGMKTSC